MYLPVELLMRMHADIKIYDTIIFLVSYLHINIPVYDRFTEYRFLKETFNRGI